ncbi:MAG: MEKHLA domain-containing protein [Nitrospira sp.]|nr:MAG: MEKHLA domain-containing protein [Nitrospira sp.]
MESRGVTKEPWLAPDVVAWCRLVLNSYRRWVGGELIERHGSPEAQACALFAVPCVVVTHGAGADPMLTYGNRTALTLFETTWDELRRMPSRLTAEPVNQAERAQMLARAAAHGYIADYRGIRISATGRRFLVEDATVWNVVTPDGAHVGQAATFSTWRFLAREAIVYGDGPETTG